MAHPFLMCGGICVLLLALASLVSSSPRLWLSPRPHQAFSAMSRLPPTPLHSGHSALYQDRAQVDLVLAM